MKHKLDKQPQQVIVAKDIKSFRIEVSHTVANLNLNRVPFLR